MYFRRGGAERERVKRYVDMLVAQNKRDYIVSVIYTDGSYDVAKSFSHASHKEAREYATKLANDLGIPFGRNALK